MARAKRLSKRYVLIAAILVVVMYGGLRLVWKLPSDGKTQQGAISVFSRPPMIEHLSVRLWVDKQVVGPDESARLTLRFENGSNNGLPLEILEIQDPGFRSIPLTLKTNLASHTSWETGPIELKPSTDHGSYLVTVRYRVTDSSGLAHEGTIATTSITIRNDQSERRLSFLRRIGSLSKDLMLPFVLALLGFGFQRWQSKRDAEAKQREATESRRLLELNTLSDEHYMPIVRSLRSIGRYRFQDMSSITDDQVNRLLFHFLYFLFLMGMLRKKRGTLFFKSRAAEVIVSSAWAVLKLGSDDALGEANIESALEELTADMTYSQFNAKLTCARILSDVREKFVAWNARTDDSFYSYTDLAAIMQETMYFEATRPFDQDWYGELARPNLRDADKYVYPTQFENQVYTLKRVLPLYEKEIEDYVHEHKS